MRISLTEAKAQLTELVRLAEAGDDVILTRHGKSTVRLVPIAPKPTAAEKKAFLDSYLAAAPPSTTDDAARSQDFLYNEDGLPE